MQHAETKKRIRKHWLRWLNGLASPWLTLTTVSALMLMAVIGAVVPQLGMKEESVIRAWQQKHSTITPLLQKSSCFSIFISPVFLTTLAILFVNTLACTYTSVAVSGLFSEREWSSRVRRLGFIGLHVSILICMTGGFISSAFRMRGKIVLTEGQLLNDQKSAYTSRVEGPFRKEQQNTFSIELIDAEFALAREWDYGQKQATIAIKTPQQGRREMKIAFNMPLTVNQTTFTLQEIGYSPQIIIHSENPQLPPFRGFISLKAWGFNRNREHRDFLQLPRGGKRLVFNLYPSYEMRNGQPVKTGETPDNPALLVHLESPSGPPTDQQIILPGRSIELEDMRITFGELRQWASFLVVRDPGYVIVCTSFWMAAISLALRYSPDLREWIKETRHDGTT